MTLQHILRSLNDLAYAAAYLATAEKDHRAEALRCMALDTDALLAAAIPFPVRVVDAESYWQHRLADKIEREMITPKADVIVHLDLRGVIR